MKNILLKLITVWVMLTATLAFSQPIQITFNGGGSPTASPDGQWIAYSNGGIAKIRSDGTQFTQLTDFGMEPDWSRMGDLIVFRNGNSLFALSALSGDTSLIRTGGFDDNPAWSPDGSEIALEGSYGIVIVSYPDGNISDVFCIDPDFTNCEGEGPTWSPDGYWIAFEDGFEILKVPRTGDTATVVVEDLNDVSDPSWSPNGEWIAFTREYPTYYEWHVWVTDSRGPQYGLWQVTDGTDMESSPSWSPDSDTIYFGSNRSGQWEVWKVSFNPTSAIDERAHNNPLQYCLYNNYPNPFNNNTSIGFWLAESGDVSLTIYNILGRKVRTLIDEYRLYGNHNYDFNADYLSSGVYFYRLQAGEMIETKRMVLLK